MLRLRLFVTELDHLILCVKLSAIASENISICVTAVVFGTIIVYLILFTKWQVRVNHLQMLQVAMNRESGWSSLDLSWLLLRIRAMTLSYRSLDFRQLLRSALDRAWGWNVVVVGRDHVTETCLAIVPLRNTLLLLREITTGW